MYNCAEQIIMAQKAALFGNTATEFRIRTTPDPAQQKILSESCPAWTRNVGSNTVATSSSTPTSASSVKTRTYNERWRQRAKSPSPRSARTTSFGASATWSTIHSPATRRVDVDGTCETGYLWTFAKALALTSRDCSSLGSALLSQRPPPRTPHGFSSLPTALRGKPFPLPATAGYPTGASFATFHPRRLLQQPLRDGLHCQHRSSTLPPCYPLPIPDHGSCLTIDILTVDDASFTKHYYINIAQCP